MTKVKQAWKKFMSLNGSGVLLAMIAFIILVSILAPFITGGNFLTWTNIMNVFRQQTHIGIICCAMTYVIITGNIDLSVGSLLTMLTVLCARFTSTSPLFAIVATLLLGLFCGIALAIASNLQQVGITLGTPAGKAGFLTACYIILVPLAGLFLGKKCPARIWIAVAITLAGLYLLCLSETLSLSGSDLLLLACAAGFTAQILLVDRFAPDCNPIALSIVEFLTCGMLTLIPALILEILPDPAGMLASFQTWDAWLPLLYAGLLSTGVSYTFQIIGQKNVHPTIASLLMSLESVFAVLSGWLILGETLSFREGMGCVLIFAAILLAQI